MKEVVYDIEVYSNYLVVAFQSLVTGKIKTFKRYGGDNYDFEDMFAFLASSQGRSFIGFNVNGYDNFILSAIKQGKSNLEIKEISNLIIQSKEPAWKVAKDLGLDGRFGFDCVDIMPVAKGNCGLKQYAMRLNSKSIIELPYKHDKFLLAKEADKVESYCVNDLSLTKQVYDALKNKIDLRKAMGELYGMDLRSKSDAQIAEAVMGKVLKDKGVSLTKSHTKPKEISYVPPNWVKFEREDLKELLIDLSSQKIKLEGKSYVPQECLLVSVVGKKGLPLKNKRKRAIPFKRMAVALGLGGMHSTEKNVFLESNDEFMIIDRDVTGYYPSLIITNGWYPKSVGIKFLEQYTEFFLERKRIKHKDIVKSEVLKIVLNSIFGKGGNIHSAFFDQELMFRITLTGQMALLMLIERIESSGCGEVVSANTDGIVTLVSDKNKFEKVVSLWENETSFGTEEIEYLTYFGLDVNNYFAEKKDFSLKKKGRFGSTSLDKNPLHQVVYDAVASKVLLGVNVEDYITSKKIPFEDFLLSTKVDGGAYADGELVGSVVRWYYSTQGVTLRTKKGNLVPRGAGCRPVMILPDSKPTDIDYERYIKIANDVLLGIDDDEA